MYGPQMALVSSTWAIRTAGSIDGVIINESDHFKWLYNSGTMKLPKSLYFLISDLCINFANFVFHQLDFPRLLVCDKGRFNEHIHQKSCLLQLLSSWVNFFHRLTGLNANGQYAK